LTGRAAERLRLNPRKSWWNTIAEIHLCAETTSTGDPRPDRLGLQAGLPLPCFAARYAAAPDRFVEFKPNESIRLVRNPDYWKPGRPSLDGIEYTIIPNRSTAILAFTAG
jgi:peptide/nickel transport system substrate-binding protein